MLRNEETEPIRQQLVIERFVESTGSTFLKDGIKYDRKWYDISDPKTTYDLAELIKDGWVIMNTAVSTALSTSHSGYDRRLDHTILTLEKQQ